ncbi:uncharacterized protein LOC122262080 [Penaeus japonicus]|uniref:uncharacterized protein LOC122262080 n=1 Tax=Penaeus japonicus TaxID=27405 RepID=UPI001C70BCE7|nr:uncharacterized protein LOC122262080 [Penaeus japonicus]
MKLLHRRTCQSPVDHRKGRTCSIIKETRMIRTTILKICLFAMLLSSGCSLAAASNVQRDDQASVRPVILESHHGNQPQLNGIQSGILQENILPLNLPLNTLPLNTIRPSYEAIGDVTIGEDQNGSPYYLDPERRPPSHPPHMTAEDLHSEVKKCDTDYQGPCRPTEKYRNHNGRCNNLHFPEFGAVNQPMPRILPPVLQCKAGHSLQEHRWERVNGPGTLSALKRGFPVWCERYLVVRGQQSEAQGQQCEAQGQQSEAQAVENVPHAVSKLPARTKF